VDHLPYGEVNGVSRYVDRAIGQDEQIIDRVTVDRWARRTAP